MPPRPSVRSTVAPSVPGSRSASLCGHVRVIAGDDQQAAAALDEPLQRAAGAGRAEASCRSG